VTVLVIQPLRLGDLVQSTPLLAELRKEGGPLVLAVARPEAAAAATLTGLADEVALLDEDELLTGRLGPKSRPGLSSLPDSPDLLVNLSSSKAALAFAARFKPKRAAGPRQGPRGLTLPPAQRLAAAIMATDRRLGRLNLVDLWRLLSPAGPSAGRRLVWPSEGDPALPRPLASPLVGLHLGSGNHLRRWPVERFVRLAEGLIPAGLVLLGGPGERSLARRFLDLWGPLEPRPLDLSGRTALKDLGPVLAGLDLFVSADTGVMHIAAASGAKTLAVFGGPALAGETGPYAPGSVIVQGRGPCAPCPENRPCPSRPCPALPDVGPVLNQARRLLGLDPGPGPDPRGSPDIARAYMTGQDDLGQILNPADQAPLDDREALAMAVREASAALLNPSRPGPGLSALAGRLDRRAESPSPLATVKSIASLAFDDRTERKTFTDLSMAALKLLSGHA
jgi:ADP-heptose:LPS heptosyltransferase